MLRRANDGYSFFTELMRRWVAERKSPAQGQRGARPGEPIAEQQYQLGHTYYRLGNLKDAVGPLQAALQANPNHLKARLLLGETLREQGVLAKRSPSWRTPTAATTMPPAIHWCGRCLPGRGI